MNKEEILAMDNEQLKRAVATEIMKLSIYHYDKDVEANCYYMLIDENLDAVANDDPFNFHEGERKTQEEAWKDCPEYSTDISATFEVISTMQTKGWMLYKLAHTLSRKSEADGYICIFLNIESGASRETIADTAPEAICKSALLTQVEL